MRIGYVILIATVIAALSPVLVAAADVAWGLPVDGLRLGIALDKTLPEPSFRVSLQNITAAPIDIQIALRTSAEDVYRVSLFVIEPDGTSHGLFDSRHPAGGIAGKVSPLIIHIELGGAYELLFPFDKLSLVELGKRVAVQVLLDRGWTFQARGPLSKVLSGKLVTPSE
jgi:hypothetical protein